MHRPYKNDPLSQELRKVRLALREKQYEFCRHFSCGRTVMTNWETRGVPDHVQVRLYIEYVLRKLRRRARKRGAKI